MSETSMSKNRVNVRDMVLCSLFVALCAVGAFIQIPLPNSDYFTLQFLFVIMAGMLLGSKKGFLALSIYIIMGLVGFPIFAAGGGISYVLRPTFGYLIGFAVGAYLTGYITEKNGGDTFIKLFIAGFVGFLVIYLIGFSYKYMILNFYTGVKTPIYLILIGAFPIDMPGDLIATFLASAIDLRIRKVVKI